MNRLPAVRRYLGLRGRFEKTHTPIAGLAFVVELSAKALWRIKQAVAQPKGGKLTLVRHMCGRKALQVTWLRTATVRGPGLEDRVDQPGSFKIGSLESRADQSGIGVEYNTAVAAKLN